MADPTRYGLGRRPAEDLRDLNYLMRTARPAAFMMPLARLPSRISYKRGLILDQGQTGMCVEFGHEAKLRGTPVVVGEKRLPPRYAVYDAAILVDEFPDNDHDPDRQMGTSVRAGAKVLQAKGLIESYHWTYDVDEVLQWMLSGQGGLVFGIDWYRDMFEPTPEGIIRPTGGYAGGHCIYGYGVDKEQGWLLLQQSWGPGWGGWRAKSGRILSPGCCRLPLDDLRTLLKGNGEACAIVETPFKRGRQD